MELADQQNLEAEGALSGAEIPSIETPSPDTAPEKPLSIRDQLNKSIETVRTEEAKRARDVTTGKFAKTEASAEKPAAEKPEIPKTEQNATPKGPPSAWKDIWDKLPPEAQAIAFKRETEVEQGFERTREKVKQYDALEQVIAPTRARFQQMGINNDAQALHNIFSWEAGLSNPATRVKAFRDLAQQIGVDLSTLAQNPSSASIQDIPEPLRPVIDQFGNIVQDLNGLKAEFQRSREDKISQELSSFAKDKPHFEKVRVIMGQLMTAGLVPPGDLEGAYQKATVLHPEVAAQIKAEAESKAVAERDRANAEKAKNARLAAVSPSGRSPNGAPVSGTAKPSKGVRGDILNAIGELREGQRA